MIDTDRAQVELSLVLRHRSSGPGLDDCLETLRSAAGQLSYEVFVVDDDAPGAQLYAMDADGRPLPIPSVAIQSPTNRADAATGYAVAVNEARRLARGDVLAVIDSRVRLDPGSLPVMIDFLRRHPTAVAVSPTVRDDDGVGRDHFVRVPGLVASLALTTGLGRLRPFAAALDRHRHPQIDRRRAVPLLSRGCLVLGPEALRDDDGRALPVFDDDSPTAFAEAVLVDRLHEAGGTVWTLPQAGAVDGRDTSPSRPVGDEQRRDQLAGLLYCLHRVRPGQAGALAVAVSLDRLVRRVSRRRRSQPSAAPATIRTV